jgi:Zn-dependent peptidase ImmA (M78 family)
LSISRLDLDGLGSPTAIAAKIHELQPELPSRFAIENLCRDLDITAICEVETGGFEAALIMDANKAEGSILLAAGRPDQRKRFSIGHELGHFLIPAHLPHPDDPFECSLGDLLAMDASQKNRRLRREAEANRFAAALLMPPSRVRAATRSHTPDLSDIIRLADEFGVSKEAMARTYLDASREALAVIILHHGRLARVYRNKDFPWIERRIGQGVPEDSLAFAHAFAPGELSEFEECEAEMWMGERAARRVEILTEQVLGQGQGYSMLMLHAELAED